MSLIGDFIMTNEVRAKKNVHNALKSLLYEVSVTPKPGLVDPSSHGAHPDMTVFTFIDSSLSLEQYFYECAAAGFNFTGTDLTQLFRKLRPLGIQAEKEMFLATKNINTHKGAIFSVGIAVAAVGYLEQTNKALDAFLIRTTIRDMLVDLISTDFNNLTDKAENELTAGERHFLKYGKSGIRGEAQAGFPVVFEHALPFFKASSGPINERLLDTLMIIARNSEDSNLIKRAGNLAILDWLHEQIDCFFDLGGSQTSAGKAFLRQLDVIFSEKQLSLGGSADLLILTVFLSLTLSTANQ
jgi:triphosphoribosyl-dephospho-CoA synthase|nr:triphosphoribosyl-dephospho-CoA synthase CitG [Loigolactobacillus coryniformis]